MNDGRGGRPRLPDDDAYWEALATRIERAAAPLLAAERTPARVWWTGPRLSPALAAAAIVAAGGAWLFLPDRAPLPGGAALTGAALAPSDPLGAAVFGDPVPPAIEGLLNFTSPEDR